MKFSRTLVLVILCVFLVLLPSCQRTPQPPQPTSLPTYIAIPNWVQRPHQIESWLRSLKVDYLSDKETTGYEDYRFTPAEFFMTEIPDVNSKGKTTIRKPILRGDCDDYAILTAYLMSQMGLKAYYQTIFTRNAAHAISYGIDQDGRCHIFDLWFYQGTEYRDINEYIQRRYPYWIKWQNLRIEDYLKVLFIRGHVEYHPDLTLTPKVERPRIKKKEKQTCPIYGCE